MKILFLTFPIRIPPPRLYPPVGLLYVASSLNRAGFSSDFLDLEAHPMSNSEVERFFETNRYDVIATGCIVTGYKHLKKYLTIIKRYHPNTIIVVGNTVASSIPELLLSKTQADIAAMGEGDESIVDIITCIQSSGDLQSVQGICYTEEVRQKIMSLNVNKSQKDNLTSKSEKRTIKCTEDRQSVDLTLLPNPDWSTIDMETYIKSMSSVVNEPGPPIPKEQIRTFPLSITRGCPYRCTFCFHNFHGQRYRRQPITQVIPAVKYLHEQYGVNHVTFSDDLSIVKAEFAEELADAILNSGLKIYWEAICRSDTFEDKHRHILEKMKRAGCVSVSYSLESANEEILKWIDKRTTPTQFINQSKLLREFGIGFKTSIIIGFPTETRASIQQTIDCCIEARVYPSAGFLLPLPETPMYDYAKQVGKIGDDEDYLLTVGDRQDFLINLTKMSDDELQNVTTSELNRLATALGLSLDSNNLFKTNHRRAPADVKQQLMRDVL